MIGLAIAGGAVLASSLIQYYNAEKARGASRQRLRNIEEIFNKVKAPDLDVSIYDDPEMVKGVDDANFDFTKLTPEEYRTVGKYVPQVADFVQEAAPHLVEKSAIAKTGRDAQLEALHRYREIGNSDFDPRQQEELNKARDQANRDAQSRSASALLGMERRGVGGSTADYLAATTGAADAFNREGDMSMRAAAEGYRNRLDALGKGAALGGDIERSEMDEAETNAKIANDYNQRFSKRFQDYLTYRADTANQAAIRNLDASQRTADANVSARNKFSVEDLERRNKLAQQVFQNARAKRQDRLDLAKQKNDVLQQRFNNDYRIAQGKAGIQDSYRQDTIDRAHDYNSAARGIGDSVAAGGMAYEKYNQDDGTEDDNDLYRAEPGTAGYDYGDSGAGENYRRNPSQYGRTV